MAYLNLSFSHLHSACDISSRRSPSLQDPRTFSQTYYSRERQPLWPCRASAPHRFQVKLPGPPRSLFAGGRDPAAPSMLLRGTLVSNTLLKQVRVELSGRQRFGGCDSSCACNNLSLMNKIRVGAPLQHLKKITNPNIYNLF